MRLSRFVIDFCALDKSENVLTVQLHCDSLHRFYSHNEPFDANCCHMGTAMKHPVPDRVNPYAICNFWHPSTLTVRAERQSAQMSKITNEGLTTGCFIASCTHMATMGVKGLSRLHFTSPPVKKVFLNHPALRYGIWICYRTLIDYDIDKVQPCLLFYSSFIQYRSWVDRRAAVRVKFIVFLIDKRADTPRRRASDCMGPHSILSCRKIVLKYMCTVTSR